MSQNRCNLQRLTRRSMLGGAAAVSSTLLMPSWVQAQTKVPFGVATQIEHFQSDSTYRNVIAKRADMVVPMNALKWGTLRYKRDVFNFGPADEILKFAATYGKSTRGHALLWPEWNPKWMDAIATRAEAEKELVTHIERVVDYFRGRVREWDVVNEVISHDPLTEGFWRNNGPWLRTLGPEHVDIAFKTAARIDPSARLVINDYDLENVGPRFDARREGILKIVRHLQDKNIPVHGVGLQAHLYGERRIDADALMAFVRQIKALGLDVVVTELDVIDWRLPRNIRKRDKAAAKLVDSFLQPLFAASPPTAVVAWGITDRYSWVNDTFRRDDGAAPRPLPLDSNYRKKPMFETISRYAGG